MRQLEVCLLVDERSTSEQLDGTKRTCVRADEHIK